MTSIPDLQQVNFAAAELRNPVNILSHLSKDKGISSNSMQFNKGVDMIVDDLRNESMFVFYTGSDVKQVLDRIIVKRMLYFTRIMMNKSDDNDISRFKREDSVLVKD